MTGWWWRLYPLLFAIVPILDFAANNPAQYASGDLLLVLAVAVAGCAMAYAIAAVALRRRAPASLVPVAVLLAVGWAYAYNQIVMRLPGGSENVRHAVTITVGLTLTVAVLWWLRRREQLLDGAARFLTLMGALLVSWSMVTMATGWFRGRRAIERSALVDQLARPIGGPAAAREPMRDIYLIVLDEYANAAVLRERFGFDNRPFEDSLRALGFHVPREVRSNYTHTLLSLPSLLNAAHLVGLTQDLGPETRHPALPNYLLEHNRVVPFLERRGYHFVFFPSQWWFSTSGSSLADSEFTPWRGFDLTRSLAAGELQRKVRGLTILRYLDRDHGWEAAHVRRTLRGLAEMPKSEGPVFAFAHIVKPHDPYVFDRDCQTLPRGPENDDLGPYIEQLRCVNRMVLATVRRILERSEVPPIILLQGDHGTLLLHATGYKDPDKVPAAAARERLGAFGAYYLPDGGAAAFGDTVTVVNVMGNVLRYYFGASLPRAADEQYISPAKFPYDFRRVDARWLSGDDSATPAGRDGR